MEVIQGKIQAKSFAKTKADATYATFTIDGKNYNVFDKEVIDNHNLDDFVEIEVDKNAKGYWELKSMKKVKSESVMPKKQAQNGSNKEFHLSPEQVRTNAMDLTLKMIVSNKENEVDFEGMIEMTKKIEEYLWKGGW